MATGSCSPFLPTLSKIQSLSLKYYTPNSKLNKLAKWTSCAKIFFQHILYLRDSDTKLLTENGKFNIDNILDIFLIGEDEFLKSNVCASDVLSKTAIGRIVEFIRNTKHDRLDWYFERQEEYAKKLKIKRVLFRKQRPQESSQNGIPRTLSIQCSSNDDVHGGPPLDTVLRAQTRQRPISGTRSIRLSPIIRISPVNTIVPVISSTVTTNNCHKLPKKSNNGHEQNPQIGNFNIEIESDDTNAIVNANNEPLLSLTNVLPNGIDGINSPSTPEISLNGSQNLEFINSKEMDQVDKIKIESDTESDYSFVPATPESGPDLTDPLAESIRLQIDQQNSDSLKAGFGNCSSLNENYLENQKRKNSQQVTNGASITTTSRQSTRQHFQSLSANDAVNSILNAISEKPPDFHNFGRINEQQQTHHETRHPTTENGTLNENDYMHYNYKKGIILRGQSKNLRDIIKNTNNRKNSKIQKITKPIAIKIPNSSGSNKVEKLCERLAHTVKDHQNEIWTTHERISASRAGLKRRRTLVTTTTRSLANKTGSEIQQSLYCEPDCKKPCSRVENLVDLNSHVNFIFQDFKKLKSHKERAEFVKTHIKLVGESGRQGFMMENMSICATFLSSVFGQKSPTFGKSASKSPQLLITPAEILKIGQLMSESVQEERVDMELSVIFSKKLP